jgi:hypothetical protein
MAAYCYTPGVITKEMKSHIHLTIVTVYIAYGLTLYSVAFFPLEVVGAG